MISQKELAARIGVSRTAVSRVLSGTWEKVGIRPETRDKILAAAREHGYRPDARAREIVTNRPTSIAVLMAMKPLQMSLVTGPILAGAVHAADDAGYFLRFFCWKENSGALERVIQAIESRPFGLVFINFSAEFPDAVRDELQRWDLPTVNLESSASPKWGMPIVRTDDVGGMEEAVERLAGLGHRRIGMLASNRNREFGRNRWQGYMNAMARLGLEPDVYELTGGIPYEEELHTFLTSRCKGNTPMTAMTSTTDYLALDTMRTCRRLEIRVPEDLSVMGFAGLPMSEYCDPRLSTVTQPFGEIGRKGIELLLAQGAAEGGVDIPPLTLIPPEIVMRESTAAPSQ